MYKLLLAVPGLALSTGAALADDCAVNPSTPTYSPDNNQISLIFDLFEATPIANAKCTLSIPSLQPSDKLTVYSASYQGFVEEGDTTTLTVKNDGSVDSADVPGPQDGEYHTGYVGTGSNGKIDSDLTLALDSSDEDSTTTLDSIDYVKVAQTTQGELETSLGEVATGETALVTHLGATAGLLVGSDQPLQGDDELSLVGGVGSYMLGLTGRSNFADGWTVLGGVSVVDQSAGGAAYGGVLASAAVRYLDPTTSGFRPFGEAGLTGGGLSATFTRQYDQGTDDAAIGSGTTSAGLGSIYGRGGVLIDLDEANQVAVSGTLQESVLGLGGYDETFANSNIFAASLPGQSARFTTVKATASWTTQLTDALDLTATGSLGATIAHDPVSADVAFAGNLEGAGQGTVFGEYGVRLGWDVSPTTKVDGFVQGSTGTGVGTHAQIGSSVHLKF
jgi:hypothetical protein